jgi:hypothetical protein
MHNSRTSQSSYSQQSHNGSRYANIITTISVALCLLFWTFIYNKLDQLDTRLRNVETSIAKIQGLNQSISYSPGRPAGPELNNSP